MKDEEINIAIAEYCGWFNCISQHADEYYLLPARELEMAAGRPVGRNLILYPSGLHYPLPNCAGDLNAMREAETLLATEAQWISYGRHLTKKLATFRAGGMGVAMQQGTFFLAVHASPREKAECYLKAVGKWRD